MPYDILLATYNIFFVTLQQYYIVNDKYIIMILNTINKRIMQKRTRNRQGFLVVLCSIVSLCGGVQAMAQCPEVGYERASQNPRYVDNGWDTAVTCITPSITLIPDFTVTAMTANGQYQVDTIPYNPPDTTFHSTSGVGGGQIPISVDDGFHTVMPLPFPFNFFGTNYRNAVVGGNGIVSFDPTVSGQYCQYSYTSNCPIPNASFPHKNAIYGVYEDIDPRYTSNQVTGPGIFQSIYDAYPCRKLCVSYNGISQYGYSSEANTRYCTYQIVCYEGTNIIEVHVNKRSNGASTNNGCGLIGIQNATGTTAFVARPRNASANGYNPFPRETTINREAFRFTPLGDTVINFQWYRGQDTLAENLIYSGVDDPTNDTLIPVRERFNNGGNRGGMLIYADSKLNVQNITTSQYITVRMRFTSAGVNDAGQNILYDMKYTFHVGVDKDVEMDLSATDHSMCRGESDSLIVSIPEDASSDIKTISWSFTDGSYRPETEQRIRQAVSPRGNTGVDSTSRIMTLQPYQWPTSTTRFTDTVIAIATVTFHNGCTNYDTVMLRYVNNKNYTTDTFTCEGKPFLFWGEEFSTIGTHYVEVDSFGCAYKQVLKLDVKDTNYTRDEQIDCHPLVWGDSTYYESTNEPTIRLANQWGCDSVVNLHFTFVNTLKAIIEASPKQATLDDLNIMFKDVSLASTNRRWLMPDGSQRTDVTVYYTFPTDLDSITTTLVAMNQYGCEDTTSVTIPLLKESIWFPNAFTPSQEENPYFFVKGIGITSLHVEIYNRQGVLVARWDGIDGHWDGTDLHGELCPQGAYMYVAKWTTVINPMNPERKRGTVMLIR